MFDIDVWYPRLKKYTFRTTFIPLMRAEARAIVKCYRRRFVDPDGTLITRADVHILRKLETRLHEIIESKFSANGCFMRLCGRSAKDAEPREPERIRREYQMHLERLKREEGNFKSVDDLPASLKMKAAGRVNLLLARSGADVMSMLLSSERVYSDMLDWLWFGEPEQVVLREWERELSVDYEFRCYVKDGRLNAISQYDHYCKYDHLFPRKAELERRIRTLWSEIHPHVGASSYGMDFGYLPEQDRLVMIELSPFLRCTGAHCFRWSNAYDNAVLHGRRPFEFRLVQQTFPEYEALFQRGWTERWTADPPPFWAVYETNHSREAFVRDMLTPRCNCTATLARRLGPTPWVLGTKLVQLLLLPVVLGLPLLLGHRMSTAAMAGVALAVTFFLANMLAIFVRLLPWVPTWSRRNVLFVYGTLKRGMHWNRKFMSGSTFVGRAITHRQYPLVVGACGVPYLIGDMPGAGERIRGEVWLVDDDTLEGLDDYEGLGKGYYKRIGVRVNLIENQWTWLPNMLSLRAHCYVMHEAPDSFLALPCLQEYTLKLHKTKYHAVRHILLKQQLYLQGRTQYSHVALHPRMEIDMDAKKIVISE